MSVTCPDPSGPTRSASHVAIEPAPPANLETDGSGSQAAFVQKRLVGKPSNCAASADSREGASDPALGAEVHQRAS